MAPGLGDPARGGPAEHGLGGSGGRAAGRSQPAAAPRAQEAAIQELSAARGRKGGAGTPGREGEDSPILTSCRLITRERRGDGRGTPGPGAAHTRGARQAGRAAPRAAGIARTELGEAQTPGAGGPRRPLGSRCSAQSRGRSGPGSGSGSHPRSSPPPPGGPAARGRAGGGAWLYISPRTPPGRAQRPEPRRLPAPLPALRGGGGSSSSNMAVDGCSGWRWRREELPRAPAPAARC